jgi:hypothetical protein
MIALPLSDRWIILLQHQGFSLINHKPACRLLLLDALNKERQIKYYRNNGFEFLLDDDVTEENRVMHFDFLPFSK